MATVTLAGQIVRANRSLGAILDRSVDELVGTSYAAFAGTATGALRAAARRDPRRHGGGRSGRARRRRRRCAPRRVVATFAPVLDSSRRPLYLFVQVQDVTVQRGAEEELRRSEVRFRLLVDNVEDYAIFMLSPEGLVESWNAGAQRIKGYTEDEIVGRHFRTFYPPEVQEARHPEHELELALRDGHYEEEGWRVRKDGSRFWATVLITAVHDRDGRHVGFAKVTRDVTRRREQDEALRASEERFRLLVETVSDYAIFMLSPEGLVASWNAGAQRSKGYTADEIIGQHFRDLLPARAPGVAAPRARAGAGDARRPLRGGGLADPQGRQPLLGQRRHHRGPRRPGSARRLRQGHPRHHRAQGDARGARVRPRPPSPRPTPGSSRPPRTRPTSSPSPPTSCARRSACSAVRRTCWSPTGPSSRTTSARSCCSAWARAPPGCGGCSTTC